MLNCSVLVDNNIKSINHIDGTSSPISKMFFYGESVTYKVYLIDNLHIE